MYNHLLVPIDGSDLSLRAQDGAIALAVKLGARITALVVEAPPPIPMEGSPPVTYTHDIRAEKDRGNGHAQTVLGVFESQARAQGVVFSGQIATTTAVDAAIVAAAVEFACDLVVMGTHSGPHGRGTIAGLLFGSHTRSVIERCELPVLVLR